MGAIIQKKHKEYKEEYFLLILLQPLNFTFMFLFYTETISLISILMLYKACILQKEKNEFQIGLIFISVFSLLCRQTNIIWINYIAILREIINFSAQNVKIPSNFFQILFCFVKEVLFRKGFWKKCLWLFIVDGLFMAFFCWNDFQIVLGHQEHHKISLHPT